MNNACESISQKLSSFHMALKKDNFERLSDQS